MLDAARTDAPPVDDWRVLLLRLTGIDPTRCQFCGGTLRSTPLTMPPPRKPPDDSS